MSINDFELATAKEKLRLSRLKMKEYILDVDRGNKELSQYWYNVFNKNIDVALKCQALKFSFGAGGSTIWYSKIFAIFSEVLLAEYEHGKLLAAKFNPPEYEVSLEDEEEDGEELDT